MKYRELESGEIIQAEDEYYNELRNQWYETNCVGKIVGRTFDSETESILRYRRPVKDICKVANG